MFFSKWLCNLFSQETLACRDRGTMQQLLRHARHSNNYRPLLEELEPIIVMSSVVWTGASGDWSAGASWTDSSDGSHHVPGLTDDAVINTAVTVTHSTNSDAVQSLTLGAASIASNLTLSGGTLTLSGTVQNQGIGALTLANGTLAGATIALGTTVQLTAGANSSTLSGVTLNSALSVPGNTTLNVTNGLALNSATLSDNGTLNFSGGTQAVTTNGGGGISGGGMVRADTSGTTITFAGDVSLSGGLSVNGVTGVTWIFHGAVSAGVGQTLTLAANGDAFINQGVWQSASGGTLTLGGIWTNNGAITVMGATSAINLGGNFATADIGTVNHTSGAVNIVGSLDNAGSTLALNNTTGTWNLFNGTISGGMITTAGSAVLNIASRTNSTLSGVALNGTVSVPDATTLNITNGLDLNGATLNVNGILSVNGTQSVTGTGTITGSSFIRADTTASTITFASGVTLSGGLGFNGAGGVTWIFQGTVSAGFAQTLAFPTTNNAFVNEGTWQSISGGTLTLGGNWTNLRAITVMGANSTLNLGGTFTSAGIGTLNHLSGTINITGTLNNIGSTLALNNSTGTWNLSGGRINGGIITTAGSAVLNIEQNTNTLNEVTLNGTVTLPSFEALNITNGLVLNTATLSGNGALIFSGGTQSMTGTGAINGNIGIAADTTGSTITLGNGVALRGVRSFSGAAAVTWIFQGTVSTDFGQELTFLTSNSAFINQGTWQAINGGTLNLGGNWTNIGTITVEGPTSTLNLGGTFTTARIGAINRTSGTINITGSLDNAGNTLALNDVTGTWNLTSNGAINGAISGGVITTAGSAVLNIAGSGTLSRVTLAGTVTLAGISSLDITNGLTLDGGTVIENGTLNFAGGTQSVTGTGTISGGGVVRTDRTGSTITFASGVTLTGGLSVGVFSSPAGVTWIFQGSVSTAFGQTVSLSGNGNAYMNQGTWRATNGGTLNLGGNWTNNGTITVEGLTSTLNLGGAFTTAGIGTINRTSGTVNVIGSLNNSGNTLALNDATGDWNLSNGLFTGATIIGGIITTAGSAVLNITSGSLRGVTVAGAVTVPGSLDITNGMALNGATLSGNGTLNFSGGTQSVTGTGVISGGGGIGADTNGATITFASGITLSGGLAIGGGGGTHNWIFQGTVSADVNGQTLTFFSGDTFNNQGIFEARNGGTLLLPAGPTYTNYSSATLTLAGGTWQVFAGSKMILVGSGIATDAATILLDGSGSTIFRNAAATLDALAGLASVATLSSLTIQNGRSFTTAGNLTNNGTLNVKAGVTFIVNGSLTNFDVGSGALTGGAYNIAGTFRFNNAAITTNAANIGLDGTGAAAIVDQTGTDALANLATNSATGNITIQNGRNLLSSGALTNAGTLTIGAGSTFTQSGTYTQTGTLNILNGGNANLQDGADSGALSDAGALTITPNTAFTESGAFSQSGVLDIQGTLNLNNGGASSGAINNAGALVIGAGSTLTVSGPFTQTGTLSVQSIAIVNLSGGGSISGNLGIAFDGTLDLSGGSFTLADGTTFAGAGVLQVSGATVSIAGALSISQLRLDSGNLNGGGVVMVTTAFTWAGGTQSGSGLTNLAATAILALSGAGTRTLDQRTLSLAGTTIWTDGGNLTLANSATLVNQGTGHFISQDDSDKAITGSGSFINAGTLSKVGAGTLSIASGIDFTTGSTVNVQAGTLNVAASYIQITAGITNLSSGATLTSAGGVILSTGSALAGAGTINADVTNAGEMSIGDSSTAGILTINGFFFQTSSGTLTVKIGGVATPGSDFDQLVFTSGHLGGTLNVTLINGYTPASGDSIMVMTFDLVTGTFAELAGDGGLFTAAYDPMDVTLTAN
jgi:hypothetical protein